MLRAAPVCNMTPVHGWLLLSVRKSFAVFLLVYNHSYHNKMVLILLAMYMFIRWGHVCREKKPSSLYSCTLCFVLACSQLSVANPGA